MNRKPASTRPRALRLSRRTREAQRGMTLLEVLVSVTILAMIASLIYGAFDGMSRSRQGLSRINDRYHQGRGALARMTRELQSAFISAHVPLVANQAVRATLFLGTDSASLDRVDFTSFSHRRLRRDIHESDQNELSYFTARDPEDNTKIDLVRREATQIDLEPDRGGVVQVLAENIESFELSYLDPLTGEWSDTWDSTQPAGQLGRLPMQVRMTLLLKGGIGDKPLKVTTKAPIAMQTPLAFAFSTANTSVSGNTSGSSGISGSGATSGGSGSRTSSGTTSGGTSGGRTSTGGMR
jgi:general secretion pathway protein J